MSKPFLNKQIPLNGLLITLLAFVILPLSAGAATSTEKGFFNDKGPIEITSDRLVTDNEKGLATFSGNVVATQGQTTLKADWMEVQYKKDGEIKVIHAKGHVVVTKKDQKVTAREALYYRDKQLIVFTGNPVAEDPKTVVRGSRITYNLQTGNSEVENSHLTIKQEPRKDGS